MVLINAELSVYYVTKLATVPRHPWCKVRIKEMSTSDQCHPQPPQPNHKPFSPTNPPWSLGIVVLVTPHLKSSPS
ncbi:hypothetical protein AAG906_041056 [Vitis piasezkii]